MELCLLLCFCILFKRQLESVRKVFMSEVDLAILKLSEPIEAYRCIKWNVTVQMWHTNNRKRDISSLRVEP